VRAITTGGSADMMWNVAEFRIFDQGKELQRAPKWRLRAQPNPWDVQLAFDNSLATRWRSWQLAAPGMFVGVDFGEPLSADTVTLEMPTDWNQFGIRIEASEDGSRWTPLAEKAAVEERPIRENLRLGATAELKARGVRYLLIGNDDIGSEDFQQRAAAWGIRFIDQKGYMRLYYIE
jgi:hypothetical protein